MSLGHVARAGPSQDFPGFVDIYGEVLIPKQKDNNLPFICADLGQNFLVSR
jgi:hypothetical protein